jgi:hypothetical protein
MTQLRRRKLSTKSFMYTSGRTIGTVLERLTQKVQIRTTKVLEKEKIILGKRFLSPRNGKNPFSGPLIQ